ncbi:MAG TPA: DUF3618 domain-containing protein [Vicinamibacterales bacterium]|nr:DUF3618 domain-containing protein [Vicinamibacterales bacterium]
MAQDPNQVSTAEIRSNIERTRAELGHTIDVIQDRLSPRRVMNDAKGTISDATLGRAKRLAHRVTQAVHSGSSSPNVSAVFDRARSNPTMTALIGTAVSALVFALMTRSRRPTLARTLGGLALSLGMASFAQHRSQRQPTRDPYPTEL